MFTLSNMISLLRGPLAFLFIIHNPTVRACTILAAMATDFVDGYLARKYKATTKIGAIIDPLMDKFFVFFVLSILFWEHSLELWQLFAMISRDIALFIFGCFLIATKKLRKVNYQSILWGKIITALQFCILFTLSLHHNVIPTIYILFFILSIFFLIELFLLLKTDIKKV